MKEDPIPYPVPAEAVSKEGIAQRSGSCEWELRYPKWLYQFLPQAYVTSRPFFTMEIRRQRALAREDDLIHLSIYRPWHILRIALGVWGLLISGMMISDTPLIFLDLIWHILGVLLILSLLDRFVLDFAGIIAPLDSISRDIIERRWSLVRLSDVSMRHLVRAKYAVAQIQVWPIMLSVIGIRLVVVVLSSLTLLVTPLIIPHNKVVNVYEPGLLTFMIVAVAWVIASVIFVIEPRWRLHTLVAAGLAVSS